MKNVKKERNPIIEITNEMVVNMIHEIRGQKVMLDFELAELYGYETKYFNRQVQRNIERFPEEFMFKLTSNEVNNISRCKNVTLNLKQGQNIKYAPYAFTEQGIYMLMTVLKGEIAVKQSIALIKAFKAMKDYISNNNLLPINEVLKIGNETHQNTKDITEIKETLNNHTEQLKIVMENFNNPSKMKHYIIKKNERIESDIAYQEIYSSADHSIIILDDYINVKTLGNLKVCHDNIKVFIFSDNKSFDSLSQSEINDFIMDKSIDIKLYPSNRISHDRYIMVDYKTENEKLYHCGSSSKDSGASLTTITELEFSYLYHEIFDKLLEGKQHK